MKRYLVLLPALSIVSLLAACGPDAELVKSGKIHTCNMQKANEGLKEKPDDADLAAQAKEASELLDTVIETAPEGQREALKAAIAQAVAKGCD
jgi:hypothetical protein